MKHAMKCIKFLTLILSLGHGVASAQSVLQGTYTYQLDKQPITVSIDVDGNRAFIEVFDWWGTASGRHGIYKTTGTVNNNTATFGQGGACKIFVKITPSANFMQFSNCIGENLRLNKGNFEKKSTLTKGDFLVKDEKTYFYQNPKEETIRKAFVLKGDKVTVEEASGIYSNDWINAKYVSSKGVVTKGYLKTSALAKIQTNSTQPALQATEHLRPDQDAGSHWLKEIFTCKKSANFCFPNSNNIYTKRMLEYFSEADDIYGMSDLNDKERIIAEKKYKNKWKDIYPLKKDDLPPFGRGNGNIDELKKVTVKKLSDMEYRVIIDYGNNIKTSNDLKLIKNGNSFLIDFMKSDFLE